MLHPSPTVRYSVHNESITPARAATPPSSVEHCSHILPARHEIIGIDRIHQAFRTHPKQDRVIQIVEQLVQVPP